MTYNNSPITGYVLEMDGIAGIDIYDSAEDGKLSLNLDKIIPLPDNKTIAAMDPDDRYDALVLYKEIVRGTSASPHRIVIVDNNTVAFAIQDRLNDSVFSVLAATYCKPLVVSHAGNGVWKPCGTLEFDRYGDYKGGTNTIVKTPEGKTLSDKVWAALGIKGGDKMNHVAMLVHGDGVSGWVIEDEDFKPDIRRDIDDDTIAFHVRTWEHAPTETFARLASEHKCPIRVDIADDGNAGLQGTWEFDAIGRLYRDTMSIGNPGNTSLYNEVWRALGHEPEKYL